MRTLGSHVGYGSCRLHAGATRNGVIAAEKERLGLASATLGHPIYVDPVDALLGELHRTAGTVAWLGERVAEADEDELVDGASRIRALVALYLGERAHLAKVAESAIRAGFDERCVRIAEHQAVVMSRATIAVLEELGLPETQVLAARQMIGRRLRE